MKFRIHKTYKEYVIVEGETIKECQEQTALEISKRGWNRKDCWSEEVKQRFL